MQELSEMALTQFFRCCLTTFAITCFVCINNFVFVVTVVANPLKFDSIRGDPVDYSISCAWKKEKTALSFKFVFNKFQQRLINVIPALRLFCQNQL